MVVLALDVAFKGIIVSPLSGSSEASGNAEVVIVSVVVFVLAADVAEDDERAVEDVVDVVAVTAGATPVAVVADVVLVARDEIGVGIARRRWDACVKSNWESGHLEKFKCCISIGLIRMRKIML